MGSTPKNGGGQLKVRQVGHGVAVTNPDPSLCEIGLDLVSRGGNGKSCGVATPSGEVTERVHDRRLIKLGPWARRILRTSSIEMPSDCETTFSVLIGAPFSIRRFLRRLV
jgi:hypothetical protein